MHTGGVLWLIVWLIVQWLMAPGLFAQQPRISDLSIVPTHAQAVVSYTAPDDGPCSIEVSTSPHFQPVAHDVNGILFPGANLDSRTGSLIGGRGRVVVLGTRKIETASDEKNYSRGLQNDTTQYLRITCNGAQMRSTFRTLPPPMGVAVRDPLILDPRQPGRFLWPAITGSRSQEIVDPQTGTLLKRISAAGDEQPN